MTDAELLRRYVSAKDQEAFGALVHQHTDWVYSSAKRMVRDGHLAEDVAQGVFLLLTRKAAGLQRETHLAGWLFRATQYCAREAMRGAARRAKHQREAAMRQSMAVDGDAAQWDDVWPVVDEAVGKLGNKDREAVLLRFYRGLSLAEVGRLTGISEEAARKRVDRAVEKLRGVLAGKGIMAGAAGLSMVLAEQVTATAPPGLAESISLAAGSGGTGAGAILAKGAMKMMVWARLKAAALIVGLVSAATIAAVFGVTGNPKDNGKGAAPATLPPLTASTGRIATTRQADINSAILYRQACALLPSGGPDQQAIGNWDTAPLNPSTADLLKRYQPCLDLLHRAAIAPSADWQMEYTVKGMGDFMREAVRLRTLDSLLLLHARALLSEHRDAEAVTDVTASLALARHLSAEPVAVSRLVSLALTFRTARFTAACLPQLSPPAIRDLAARINDLPPMTTAADMVRAERKYAAAVGHEQGIDAMVQQLDGLYDELTQVVMLPPDQSEKGMKELAQKAKESGPMASILFPSFSKAMETDRYAQVQEAMLRAAIQVQLNGVDSLKAVKDTFGDGAFAYQKLPGGFELRSKLVYKGESATLRVGQGTEPK